MSFVLLWQPPDCIHLFVIDYIFLCYSQKIKYDEDDISLQFHFV